MKETIRSLVVLAVSAVCVHTFYVQVVHPRAEQLIAITRASGQAIPREWFIIIKDVEQEICIVLMFYCVVQILVKLRQIAKEQYLFDVDLLQDSEQKNVPLTDSLHELDSLPLGIGNSQLITTLRASLRRYRITGDVQNTSDAIQTSVDALSMRLDAENTMIRYVIWAIPSIGFIGTVRGIGQALADADKALTGDISGMTASLGVAFNSTFVALIISIFLMLLLHSLQRAQDKRLVNIQAYCEEFLLNRISR